MNESELRSEDSLQSVKYLGKTPSSYSHGVGIAIEPAKTLWKRTNKGSQYNRCAISIDRFGLCIYEEIANGTYKIAWTDAIENISYCVAEPLHRRLFAWISRSPISTQLECHVVLCRTSKQSRLLTELLARVFYESYRSVQKRPVDLTPNLSTRCSVCDTIVRQQQLNNNSFSYRNHPDQRSFNNFEDRQQIDNYEQNELNGPMVARAVVRNYEDASIHSSSRQSFDYDSILSDKRSIKPSEYYRR
ncbi:unnamed protein product [Rotaria socialis]|uniref:PID domain-containing protein n=1 Tax=Rotaria socialis TaxID=392032 RepID=A0A818PWP8_9BILA|nr:unnamed protein product [Rotaria socialis]CAF4536468.1 unnamed protein product [Rotaria socialis]